MGVNTKAYINQTDSTGKVVPMSTINALIIKTINAMVMENYNAFNIAEQEVGYPVIRNRSRVADLHYKIFGDYDSDHISEYFSCVFPVFCTEEECEGSAKMHLVPEKDEKRVNPHHVARDLKIITNLNCDAKNITEVKDSDNWFVIDLNCWGTSKEIIKTIAQEIVDKFELQAIFIPNNCQDEQIELEPRVSIAI